MDNDEVPDGKITKIGKINDLFGKFVEQVKSTRDASDKQDSYINGYIACMIDILEGIKEGNEDSLLLDVAKTKHDADLRRAVFDEVHTAVSNLHDAYERAIK